MIDDSQLRLLAPVGLVVFALAVIIVIATSGGGSQPASGTTATGLAATQRARPPRRAPRSYRVRTGDSLSAISQKTGVPIDRLIELNPQLDPQALRVGERVKLRP